jgi:hypothetical protein
VGKAVMYASVSVDGFVADDMPYWDQLGATIVGRYVFDMTDGWDGKPPGGVDHVVVVTHCE